ncbi:MAG: lipopolysaccharide kinase InaA family protein [Candidatus Brocadiia bacterium]
MQQPQCIEPQLSTMGSVKLYLNPTCAADLPLEELGRLPDLVADLSGRPTRQAGRDTCWEWHPDWYDGPGLVVRQYVHGGLLGPLFGSLFMGEKRMLREFRTALHAVDRGVATARPVALRVEPVFGPVVRAHFVSELIQGARNLLDVCADLRGESGTDPPRAHAARAVAGSIADLHDAGILHGDLNLKNILLRGLPDRPEVFIIDFDRARVLPELALDQRMRNLERLDRSVVKWADSRAVIRPLDRVRVLRRYLERYPAWRRQWKDILRRYATAHRRHLPFRERD